MIYGESKFTCGNGWAYGLWTNFKTNGVSKYFIQKPYSEAKKGDWIVWNKGSKCSSASHVSMFISKVNSSTVKCFGQNQNGKHEFTYANFSSDGILGVLRPKIYVDEKKEENKPATTSPKVDTTSYYPKCSYKGNSIVDGLKSIKVDSSYSHREKIAKANGINGYKGTSSQNTQMLNLLKQGKLKKA